MKPEPPLLECFAKIEWAESEINDLEAKIRDLFKAPPNLAILAIQPLAADRMRRPAMPYPTGFHKVVSHVDSNGIQVWRYAVPDIPTALNVSVGAILHSLRTPLDQMLSTIAVQKHASPSKVSFPFGRDKDKFSEALAGQKKLPDDALRMIEALKPYRAGNPLLYALHALNNPDKHHPGLIPINLQSTMPATGVMVYRGQMLTVGPRTGRHFVVDMDLNFSQPDVTKAPLVELRGEKVFIVLGTSTGKLKSNQAHMTRIYNQAGGKAPSDLADLIARTKLPGNFPKDDLEIATVTPGTEFEIDAYPAFNIALGDIEGFQREPVVAVLHQMRQLVHRILLTFEKRFF